MVSSIDMQPAAPEFPQQRGPYPRGGAPVGGASTRNTGQTGQPPVLGGRAVPASAGQSTAGPSTSGARVTIAGSTPSLSTEMIGVFGAMDSATESGDEGAGIDGLTDAERAEVRRLAARDREVRQHEAAHKAAGAGVTGPASYTFVTGPDGKQYAVAGEVPITVNGTGGGDPEQVIRDMEQVRSAALAPSDPSPADRAAAAAAQASITKAEADLREQEQAERQEQDKERSEPGAQAETGARPDTTTNTSAAQDAASPFAVATAAYGAARDLTPDRDAPAGDDDTTVALPPPEQTRALLDLVA